MAEKPDRLLNKAEERHRQIVEQYPLYRETAHWTPVLIPKISISDPTIRDWLKERGLERGTREARNDYLVPLTGFFLFKDPKVAMEFKLTWG